MNTSLKFNGIFGTDPKTVIAQEAAFSIMEGSPVRFTLHRSMMHSGDGKCKFPISRGDYLCLYEEEQLLYIDRVDESKDFATVLYVIPFHAHYMVKIRAGEEMAFLGQDEIYLTEGIFDALRKYKFFNRQKGLFIDDRTTPCLN